MLRKLCVLLGLLLAAGGLHAENGYSAWLRYAPLDDAAARQYRASLPAAVTACGDSVVLESARGELIRGIRGMIGRTLRIESNVPREGAIVMGTLAAIRQAAPQFQLAGDLAPDGFWLKTIRVNAARYTIVAAQNDRGVLYGSFALLRKIALGEPIAALDEKQAPYAPVRWVNQWDNLNGSIERGYGGRSIFWENGRVREDLSRVSDYGRLLASLGLNATSISNVNADPRLLTPDFLPQIARIAEAFRPWGVRVAVGIDFGSPKTLGGLDTFDPLDARVAAWWKDRTDELYRAVPDLAGFVLKADSEGRVGPATYKRTHADAANVIARALKPHGGMLFYRGFVYDNRMDWRNLKNDRGRAAYDNFFQLDGMFDDNVVIQIKNGPIDFQVREPASPLFGALEKTNQAVELQVTQEYMGQARHLVFLVPMWKEVLDFDMQARGAGTPVKALVAGKVFGRPSGGFVGVVNVGLDDNWLGNHLSQANLYGFGRLAWNPNLSARRIAEEWTRLTFGDDPGVVETVAGMQLKSWRTYENYTGPLGLQTLTAIVGDHYGVNVEASERNGWGQWHRADEQGVGMDRTVATGTGFIGQFRPAVAKVYESLGTCPDDLLVFLHHVPYTYKLHSGKTVIQHLYDTHYEGAETAAGYVREWQSLRGRIDEQRYEEVLRQLEYQAGQAQVWRDAVANYFLRMSKIPDARDRVGNYPGRYEAEAMKLEGYAVRDVVPWEGASGGKAVACGAVGPARGPFLGPVLVGPISGRGPASPPAGQSPSPAAGLPPSPTPGQAPGPAVGLPLSAAAGRAPGAGVGQVPSPAPSGPPCTAAMRFEGAAGWYTLNVQYFDQSNGVARYRVFVGEQVVDQWTAAERLPNAQITSSTSTRRAIPGVALRPGDEIRIEGVPDGGENAALDYVEIQREQAPAPPAAAQPRRASNPVGTKAR